jgi:hypothetical protein
MAQIQTYPRKTTYDANDLILICDKTPDSNSVITNETKTITLSTISDNLDVVDSLNSLKGNVNITAGANISIDTSGGVLEISSLSGGMGGSGTVNYIPKFSASSTLTNSTIMETAGNKVGIGTTSPDSKLTIVDAVDRDMNSGGSGQFQVGGDGYQFAIAMGATGAALYHNSNQRSLTLGTNELSRLTILGTGNVGIGTTAPTAGLQVKIGSVATPADYAAFLANDTARFNSNHSNEYGIGIGYVNATADTFGMQSGTTSGVKPLSLNPFGGSVGIGTTNPIADGLEVATQVGVSGGNTQLFITGSTTGRSVLGLGDGSNRFVQHILTDHTQNMMSFHTGATAVANDERMRITSTGNVGIGTTSPLKKLEVNGDFSARGIESIGNNTAVTFPAVLGWYRIMEWQGASRGGTVIKLSTTGGNAAPTTYVMSAYKTYDSGSSPASANTLKLEQYGANLYLNKARIATDSVTNKSYLEVYLNALGSGGVAVPMTLFHDSLLGLDNNTVAFSGTVTIAPSTSVSQQELPFTVEGTTTQKFTSRNVTLYGDGSTNAGKLKFNCSANTHYTEIIGPDHSGGASYSLKLPNTLPSVSNQILESNALGVLSWIATPSGGGGGGGGTVTSVGLTMPPAFSVGNSPITGNGNISVGVTGGSSGQFLAYNGQWATPPSGSTSPGGSTASVQFRNSSGNFAGGDDLLFNGTGTLTVGENGGNQGIVIIEGADGTLNGILKLGHTSGNRVNLRLGDASMSSDYTINLPVTSPGGNNKILESNSSGQLSWIATPTGGTTYTASTGITINSGNQISNTDLGSSQFIYKNFTASTGGTATATSNNDTLTIEAGSGISTTRYGDKITIAATGSASYDDGFTPLDIYQATSDIGGNDGDFSYIRQTQSYNSSTVNTISFFVSSIGSSPEIRFALFDGAKVKTGVGTCRVNASTASLTAGLINEMALTDGEGTTVSYTCVPGKEIVLFFALKNCTIAGSAALSNSGLGHQTESYVALPTVDDPFSTTKTAVGSDPNNKIVACHFFKT